MQRRDVRRAALVSPAVLLVVLGLAASGLAQEIRYIYDDLNRLIGVVDQQGNAAEYVYDAVGNILEIKRLTADPSASVAITFVSPNKGPVGTTVQVLGKGFSAAPGDNQVAFNGTAATVTTATPTSLTTGVPSGATSGRITVTTPAGSATSPEVFTVVSPVTIAPVETAVFVRFPFQFMANAPVTWRVNNVDGGNAIVGTITAGGLYQAPAAAPAPATVTVTAISQQDTSLSASAAVTILANPDRLLAKPVSLGFPPAVSSLSALLFAPIVSLGITPPPSSALVNPLVASLTSLTRAPAITGTTPNAGAQGAADLLLAFQGVGFAGATGVQFLLNGTPDPNITVNGLTVSPDGTLATATINIAPQAVLGVRIVKIVTLDGTSTALGIGGNVFQVISP